MLSPRFTIVSAHALILLACACAPAVLEDLPAAWPRSWKGRELFHTPRAYIYARSAELAGEADRLAIEVARDFERAAHRGAPKGLLIVSDPGDEPVCADLKILMMAMARRECMEQSGRAPTDAELEEKCQAMSEMEKTAGVEFQDMLGMAAIPLPKSGILELGLPPEVGDQAGWAVLLPSDTLIGEKVGKMISAMMDRAEIGPVARLMVAPILLAMRPKMAQMIALQRKMVLFEQMAARQPDWSAEQAAKLSNAYAEGTLKPAMAAIQAEINAEARARGGPVSSQTAASSPAPAAPCSSPATAPSSTAPATRDSAAGSPGCTTAPAGPPGCSGATSTTCD